MGKVYHGIPNAGFGYNRVLGGISMKLLTASLCFICLPLFGQDNDQAASRRIAITQTLNFLEEQSVEARQQAADAQKRANDIEQALEKARAAAAFEAARENWIPGVTAQSIQRDGEVMHLKGNVKILQQKVTITADEADYHLDTGEIEPRGNVRVTQSPR
jgi:lipopolysaccharide assembly outer membrane protein LptD (OstA)